MGEKRGRGEMAIMTPEQVLAKQFRAKCRFKATVRRVIQNLYWLNDFEDQILNESVEKNIYLLTRRKGENTLSIRDKAILNKPVQARTELDSAYLYRAIGGLKCFRRYPTHVKAQLAAVTYFAYYQPGRVIFREGHMAQALYFIVSGEVIMSQLVYDPVLDKNVNQDVGRRGPGAVLGEVSLLHDIPRPVTATTSTNTEFLRLLKDDFNIVLKATVQQQWFEVQRALDMFTYFENWNDMTRRECCILAKMLAFKPDETIRGDGVGNKDYVYFVLKGQCRIIQHLYTTHYTKNGKVHYKIYHPVYGRDKESAITNVHEERVSTSKVQKSAHGELPRFGSADSDEFVPHKTHPLLPPNVELHFMQVCLLNETACFSIGENFVNRRVVAVTNVECLLIPRYWLMQRNIGNIWNRVKQYLNSHIPSANEVHQEFLKGRKWCHHEKETIDALLAKKQSVNHASMWDVPLFIRMNEKIDL
ncbi:hypothetical protein PPYR_07719 [Photinus pyralis]|uniref:Cyclic nucleotide-binding domain-containing protein n=1 Tax=Photinus pyralis TaxID=7054 RepID=A0A5N4ARA4_PHOPY|nr:uncharacterized protein LOC116169748 isoform X2 [Photinus pyralis]KAB0799839.1 hypothetical protein PPYR_07719 [Photinus pyralis]